jgi:predicted nucleic acid-binding Zn ribbon protein
MSRPRETPDPVSQKTTEARPRQRRSPGPDGPVALTDLMVPALARLGFKTQARQVQVALAWPHVVGDQVAGQTAVKHFARGRLVVDSSSPALSHQLHLQRQMIIEGLNVRLGEVVVREIRFVLAGDGDREARRAKI